MVVARKGHARRSGQPGNARRWPLRMPPRSASRPVPCMRYRSGRAESMAKVPLSSSVRHLLQGRVRLVRGMLYTTRIRAQHSTEPLVPSEDRLALNAYMLAAYGRLVLEMTILPPKIMARFAPHAGCTASPAPRAFPFPSRSRDTRGSAGPSTVPYALTAHVAPLRPPAVRRRPGAGSVTVPPPHPPAAGPND